MDKENFFEKQEISILARNVDIIGQTEFLILNTPLKVLFLRMIIAQQLSTTEKNMRDFFYQIVNFGHARRKT